tara:strand:+ start:288 stop:635 length:348 start_codon:yes stop_codon:yes gene_type:complete
VIFNNLPFKNDSHLITKLELISLQRTDLLFRLKGIIKNKIKDTEYLEILIYKGFSSCTTHPTSYEVNEQVLPTNGVIKSVDILKGPLNVKKEEVLIENLMPSQIKDLNYINSKFK